MRRERDAMVGAHAVAIKDDELHARGFFARSDFVLRVFLWHRPWSGRSTLFRARHKIDNDVTARLERSHAKTPCHAERESRHLSLYRARDSSTSVRMTDGVAAVSLLRES